MEDVMQSILYDQLDRWLQITILQKYLNADEFRFPLRGKDNYRISPEKARKDLDQLIRRTCKRFKLLQPGEKLKSEEKTYENWHREMLTVFCCINYGRMLCSVCPLSLGMEEMIKRKGAAPCSLLEDTKLFSFEPTGCIIITSGYWDEISLIQHITLTSGIHRAALFLEVKTAFSRRFPD